MRKHGQKLLKKWHIISHRNEMQVQTDLILESELFLLGLCSLCLSNPNISECVGDNGEKGRGKSSSCHNSDSMAFPWRGQWGRGVDRKDLKGPLSMSTPHTLPVIAGTSLMSEPWSEQTRKWWCISSFNSPCLSNGTLAYALAKGFIHLHLESFCVMVFFSLWL